MTRSTTATALACILLAGPSLAVAQSTPLRIMPLGNSITQGHQDSYRRPLWLALRRAGADVDFVGGMTRGLAETTQAEDFDTDHEGHWGWRADQVLAHIDAWAAAAQPDIGLIHLGTNDIGGGQDIGQTVDEIAQIIERLRRHNPRVHVLLAAIIPLANKRATQRIRYFNQALVALASRMDNASSRVIIVDQFAGFDAEQDTYDGVHPNGDGNRKMADKWLAALQALIENR